MVINNSLEKFRTWLRVPREQMRGWQRRARALIDFARQSTVKLLRDRAFESAAALAFHTLFSLLPMLVLMLVVFQAFHGLDSYREQLEESVIEFLLPHTLVTVETDSTVSDAAPNAVINDTEAALTLRGAEFDEARQQMIGRLRTFLRELGQVNFAGLGAVGLLVFIYGATALLSTIERSFNMIMGVSGGRPWYRRLMVYYTVITLGPLVLIAGQILQNRFLEAFADGEWARLPEWLAGTMVVISPLVTTWLVLFAMFVLLPLERLKLRAAAVGAAVAAILWVVAKEAFSAYVGSAVITTLYGAVAIVPLFLLWVWVTWVIVLLGLEIAATLGNFGRPEQEILLGGRKSSTSLDEYALIRLAAGVAEAFEAGDSITARAAAEAHFLSDDQATRMLSALERAGILQRVAGESDAAAPAYMPARSPNRIMVAELLALASPSPPPGAPQDRERRALHTADGFITRLQSAKLQAAGDLTLADLVRS